MEINALWDMSALQDLATPYLAQQARLTQATGAHPLRNARHALQDITAPPLVLINQLAFVLQVGFALVDKQLHSPLNIIVLVVVTTAQWDLLDLYLALQGCTKIVAMRLSAKFALQDISVITLPMPMGQILLEFPPSVIRLANSARIY
jgi:hypothetical protein